MTNRNYSYILNYILVSSQFDSNSERGQARNILNVRCRGGAMTLQG
jgi:hypothetical protein